MRIVEDNNEIHAVRPDAEYFLNFCFEFFEAWVWSFHPLTHNNDMSSYTVLQVHNNYRQQVLLEIKLYDWLQKSLS